MLGQKIFRNSCVMQVVFSLFTVAMLCFGISPAFSDAYRLETRLASVAPDLDPRALERALAAMTCAINHGAEPASRLAVIDFSLPSSEPRLWLFDLDDHALIMRELVAHGQGSGDNHARHFSNIEGSHQSSIGLFRTQESYHGKHGYSLRLDGLEPGINDQARSRAIVIHGADYVDKSWIARHGRIGRSQGCPAVPQHAVATVVDSLKGGQFLFAYYPDEHWEQNSAYINCSEAASPNRIVARGLIRRTADNHL